MSYFQEGAKSKDDQQSRSFLSRLSAKMPIGENAVSGYSSDFHGKPFTVDYYKGTQAIPQSESLNDLPMSLWNVALEVHSGRIYMGTLATFVFVFLAGILCVWCLWSGYRLRRIHR